MRHQRQHRFRSAIAIGHIQIGIAQQNERVIGPGHRQFPRQKP
jgi:hypothetical protein